MKLSSAKVFPRRRPAAEVPNPAPGPPTTEVQLDDLELEGNVNRAVLRGTMVGEPQPGRSPRGDPITVLLLSCAAPAERGGSASALCEVEVRDGIADRHRSQLRLGASVLVVGELMGAGGLWATFLTARSPA